MDTAVARIRGLNGIDASLLAQLARKSPTLLQLELLSSADGVREFVGADRGALQHLDDETLAQLALLEPTDMQMRILCTPGAIMEFLQRKLEERGEGMKAVAVNMVGRLQELVLPETPTYLFTAQDDGFLCECWVQNNVQSARASTKKVAKQLAAAGMLTILQSQS